MLFFKLKKSDELLPPPPPFPSLDIEEEPKKFSEDEKPAEGISEGSEGRLNELLLGLDTALSQEKPRRGKKQSSSKKLKGKPKSLHAKKEVSEEGLEFPQESELSFGFDDKPQNGDFKYGETKPKEVIEAEKEISGAIEMIKQQQKPPFFRRFFINAGYSNKKEKREPTESKHAEASQSDSGHEEGANMPKIQDMIDGTRQALMNLDLEGARKNYIEVIKIYKTLSPEEQARFYYDIRELYFERKSAEGLKA